MWLVLLLMPVLLYGAVVVFFCFEQSKLLFPGAAIEHGAPLPSSAQRLELTAASGEQLVGTHIPPRSAVRDRLVILGFGGNGWNGDTVASELHGLYSAADVVVFHYRGYGPSEGAPSSEALTADAPLIYDLVRARFADARIVAVGFSIGSGVASALAASRPLHGAILVTPFDSLGKVAAAQVPWLPVKLLFRNELDSAEAIARAHLPVAIVAGGGDRLVHPDRTNGLRRHVPRLVFDRTISGAGHNDIYQHPAFPGAMHDALDRILAD